MVSNVTQKVWKNINISRNIEEISQKCPWTGPMTLVDLDLCKYKICDV